MHTTAVAITCLTLHKLCSDEIQRWIASLRFRTSSFGPPYSMMDAPKTLFCILKGLAYGFPCLQAVCRTLAGLHPGHPSRRVIQVPFFSVSSPLIRGFPPPPSCSQCLGCIYVDRETAAHVGVSTLVKDRMLAAAADPATAPILLFPGTFHAPPCSPIDLNPQSPVYMTLQNSKRPSGIFYCLLTCTLVMQRLLSLARQMDQA